MTIQHVQYAITNHAKDLKDLTEVSGKNYKYRKYRHLRQACTKSKGELKCGQKFEIQFNMARK